jgi:glycosyltransferase involved in cell wall biosynthesis
MQKEFISFGFPKEKISVIYNSINLSDFKGQAIDNVRQQLGANSSQILLGIVSRISEKRKGHSILFQALKQLITDFPNIRLAVIGDGSLKPELEKEVQNLQLTDYVRFTGNRRDIPEIFAALDIVILPSLWEGLPVVLLEAMAAAKPVVATAVNGTIEVVQNGKTGILVPPNDKISLANGIRELLIDKNKAESMGLAGRLFVNENFSSKEMAQKVISLYFRLLEKVR